MTIKNGMMLWTDAYLADTGHLTTHEHGAYLLILMAMWRTPQGKLPNDKKILMRCAKVAPMHWRHIEKVIMPLFTICDEGRSITQKRLTTERKQALVKTEKARAAANARHGHNPALQGGGYKGGVISTDNNGSKSLKNNGVGHAYAMPELCLNDAPNPNPNPTPSKNKILPRSEPRGWPKDAFEEFYSKYPRKVEKIRAKKAFEKVAAKPPMPWDQFLAAVLRYAAYAVARGEGNKYTKYPATWLNAGCWDDQLDGGGGNGGGERYTVKLSNGREVPGPQVPKELTGRDRAQWIQDWYDNAEREHGGHQTHH